MALPPYYVLVASGASLAHPQIQYHYADDPPLELSAASSGHLLVMDFDPAQPERAAVQSLSPALAVAGVKVSDAPGVGVSDQGQPPRNGKMYVVETVAATDDKATPDDSIRDMHSAAALVARFKQRNVVLRTALEYPASALSAAMPPS